MKFETIKNRESGEAYEEDFSWNNDLENSDRAQIAAEQKLLELGWPEDQASRFSQAVHEAMDNAIVHGNLGVEREDGEDLNYFGRIKSAQEANAKKQVKIHLQFTKEDATARIKDEGDFVPEGIIDPTTQERLSKGSGRGSFIIENGVDDIIFSPGEITIHKRRNDNEDGI
jgi:anti-sigma regulatory factor (Ser/Thr protein kinase)